MCGQFWFFFLQKDCVTKLSILDILEGPGELKHPVIHLFLVLLSLWRSLSFHCLCLSEEHKLDFAGTYARAVTALLPEDCNTGWADNREALFCFESHLLQGTVLMRRTDICITSCNDKTGLGFSCQTIFSTVLLTLSSEGSFNNGVGVGWVENSFSFAFTGNHIEAWVMGRKYFF